MATFPNLLKSIPGVQNLLAKIFGPGANATNGPGLFEGFMIGGVAVYPPVNSERFIRDGYSGNGSVYTIVSRAHRKFGSIPRYVYKITDKTASRQLKALMKQKNFKLKIMRDLQKKAYDETVIDDSPLSLLLNHPNEYQGQDAFYESIYLYKLVCGEAFIALNRGDIKDMEDEAADKLPPLEMYVLAPQYVELIPDPANVWGVLGYRFVVNGVRHYIRKNDMIHWRSPNPNFDGVKRTHLRGLSPLEPGNKFLQEDDSSTDAAVAMQQNDGAKGALTNKQLGKMDAEQKSRVDLMINRKINNRSLKGAVTALEGDWAYLAMGQTGVEMESVNTRSASFVRLCNLFGAPPMLFLTNTTYDNVKQAEKAFITNLIAPDACSLQNEMDRLLLPAFGMDSSYTSDIDISMLPELQDEMSQMVTQLAAAWWLTPNQKLEQMNEEKSTDPNMDKVWVPNTIVLMDDAALSDTLDSFTNDPNPDPANPGQKVPPVSKGKPGNGN